MCDSVGTIGGAPVLIEFKHAMASSMVAYNPKRSTSLERKVRSTLVALHSGTLISTWDKLSLPLIWVIANRIPTDAARELDRVLSARSHDWCFHYEYGEWSGHDYVNHGKGPAELPPISQMMRVSFGPPMPWPGETRLPRRDAVALRAIAEERAVLGIYDYFMSVANSHGLRRLCNRENINLQALQVQTAKYINVISVWPGDSGQHGLCVAVDSSRLQLCFPDRPVENTEPPGMPAPYRGHLGKRTYLLTHEDVGRYWVWAVGQRHTLK